MNGNKKTVLRKSTYHVNKKNAEKDKRDTEINKMQEQENRQRETETDSERDRKSERHTDKHTDIDKSYRPVFLVHWPNF